MKKSISFLLLAAMLVVAPQQLSAQFLKKILKGAEDVLNSTLSSSSSEYGEVLGISVEWGECVRWGNNVNVKFALCNNTRSDLTLNFFNTWPSGEKHSFAIASNGDRYGVTFIYLGGAVNDDCSVTVPSGTKVQCIVRVNKAGGKVGKFKYVSIGGYRPGQKTPNFCYTSRSMDVTEASNTNRDNLKCTLPSVTVNEKSITRNERNVELAFSLLQTTGKDLNLSIGGIKVFDTDGNAYSAELLPNNNVSMISDVPVNKTLVIKDAPASTTLSIIRMTIADNYLIEWRNVTLP